MKPGILHLNAITFALLIGLLASGLLAGEAPTLEQQYLSRNQAGVRLGGWSNRGMLPADSVGQSGSGFYLTDFSSTSFYLEGHAGHWLSRKLMTELSFGAASRGDVTLVDELSGESSFGSLMIYPILAKLKYFPVGSVSGKFYPYLMAGAGLQYGRHNITIVSGSSSYFRSVFDVASETIFSYVLGGGFDWPLASVIALDFNVQYLPIDFSDELIGIKDYSSVTITFGVKYLFSSIKGKKKEQGKHRRL